MTRDQELQKKISNYYSNNRNQTILIIYPIYMTMEVLTGKQGMEFSDNHKFDKFETDLYLGGTWRKKGGVGARFFEVNRLVCKGDYASSSLITTCTY